VGDTPRDILGGQKLGVRTVGVATGDFSKKELVIAGAEFIFEDLKDTKKVLNIIFTS
jgi:phosphoglycolate phosphatase-like HAD superfamily hydrolase